MRDPVSDARALLMAYGAFEPPQLFEHPVDSLRRDSGARTPHRARGADSEVDSKRRTKTEPPPAPREDEGASPKPSAPQPPLVIGGVEVGPGERRTIEIPVARLPTAAGLSMPVHVVRGRKPGPSLFVSAAIHGDEINGVEVVGRLLRMKALERIRGTLIAAPVVNVFGFSGYSRYLPDRRDLNRSFPGSERGSLAARLAHIFMEEVVRNATHGIDLHTGALHRTNLPQLRITQGDEVALAMARRFGALVVLQSEVRDGSLRAAAAERGVPLLVFEGGEALRFDEWAIRAGLRGVLATMHHLDMLPPRRKEGRPVVDPVVASFSHWIRAPEGGILRTRASLGARLGRGDTLGTIGDAWGHDPVPVRAPGDAIVIGRTQLPVVNEGDALFHLLPLEDGQARETLEPIEAFQVEIAGQLFDPEDPASRRSE